MQSPRIAVLSPNWNFLSGSKSMHRYAEIFINNYCEKEVTAEESASYEGDIIIGFNGRPDLPGQCPSKLFSGMKVLHLLDHVFQAERSLKNLKENGIQYVMCYSKLDKYDSFFKKAYPDYVGKVISVPFGFNDLRFKNLKPFEERQDRVIALGAVNPVSDPMCLEDIKMFAEHYKDIEFTHRWRRKLEQNKEDLEDIMASLLPSFPRTKDFDYDIVEQYNTYQMFTTCESIMGYPSVKTYEGISTGSVFVGNNHPCYNEIGLISGKNCLLHKQDDIEDFKKIVKWAQENPEKLTQISKEGEKFIRENYTPQKIAKNLYHSLEACWNSLEFL